MTLSIRGVALGAAMFAILAIIFWTITAWRILHWARATQGQGQRQMSVDMLSLVSHSFHDPMFWVALVVMLTVGTMVVNWWRL
ncbi:MAG: hypothetical protein ABSC71_20790 [Candidatus Acidiferrales bacterium]|jgi:hypothetical protein